MQDGRTAQPHASWREPEPPLPCPGACTPSRPTGKPAPSLGGGLNEALGSQNTEESSFNLPYL